MLLSRQRIVVVTGVAVGLVTGLMVIWAIYAPVRAIKSLSTDVEYPRVPDASRIPLYIEDLSDSNEVVRAWAATVLGQLGPTAEPAIPPLLLALEDRSPDVRSRAAFALGRIGPKAEPAIPMLLQLLKDRHPEVRSHSALALGSIRPATPDVIAALHAATQDPDPAVQRSAKTALEINATLSAIQQPDK